MIARVSLARSRFYANDKRSGKTHTPNARRSSLAFNSILNGRAREKSLSFAKDSRMYLHFYARVLYINRGPYEMHYAERSIPPSIQRYFEREQEKAKGALLTRTQSAVLGKHIGKRLLGHDVCCFFNQATSIHVHVPVVISARR